MKNIKEKILDHIREVCNLKRLEFGCEIEIILGQYKERCNVTSLYADGSGFLTNGNYSKITANDLAGHFYKIIGLPVELNHLLRVIKKDKTLVGVGRETTLYKYECEYLDILNNYDLTKSVSENLDDPERCKLVAKLLGIK